jgi:ribosomal protein L21
MEVLRIPPFPITTEWDVPAENTEYDIYVEDLVDHSFEITSQTSSGESVIEYVLPREKVQFDREFLFRIIDKVTGEIVEEVKGPKIHILRYKNKTGYRRRQGFRSKNTRVKITAINGVK